MRKFIAILIIFLFFCGGAFSDSLGSYLSEKTAGDVISATEWNSLIAALIRATSDVALDNEKADFCISATDAGGFGNNIVIPLFTPPDGAAAEIDYIQAGVIGSGTVCFGLEERAETNLGVALDTVMGYVRNATIDTTMDTIDGGSLDDSTLAANRVLCATFTTSCVTGTVHMLYGSIYYKRTIQGQ